MLVLQVILFVVMFFMFTILLVCHVKVTLSLTESLVMVIHVMNIAVTHVMGVAMPHVMAVTVTQTRSSLHSSHEGEAKDYSKSSSQPRHSVPR